MSETIRFPVRGMTCASCVNRITRSVRKVPGVEHVRVDLAAETATVRRIPELAPDAALAAAVVAAGYEPDLTSPTVVPTVSRSGVVSRLRARLRS